MPELELPAVIGIAYHIGFRNEQLVDICCIALAESGLDTAARNSNAASADCPNGSTDRGILQWNDCYHEDIDDACADNPVCAFEHAYEHIEGGGSFDIWTTYATGAAQQHRVMVTQTAQTLGYIEQQQTGGTETVSIEVPASWVADVSNRLGIADPLAGNGPPPQSNARTYTVEQGDNLSAIAERYTGDANRWEALYALNAATIGTDPNMIQPGMVLTIPADWP